MYTIATLHDLRRHLQLADTDTADDDKLLRNLQQASHLIESLTGRRFCPYLATRAVTLTPSNPSALILPADLLELTAISAGGGALDIAEIRLLPPDQDAPASVLRRVDGSPFPLAVAQERDITVRGVWGWHDRWSTAWRDSGDTVSDAALLAEASVIHVNNTAAADQDGRSPRFHVGHLLRIDMEYLRVTAIDPVGHRLTVLRGAQGTAAVSHSRGAKIRTYAPTPSIRDLTVRYAELMSKSAGLLEAESSPLLERLRRLTV